MRKTKKEKESERMTAAESEESHTQKKEEGGRTQMCVHTITSATGTKAPDR